MDECIKCNCGSYDWTIGTTGTRCSKCGFWLPEEFCMDVDKANEYILNAVNEGARE